MFESASLSEAAGRFSPPLRQRAAARVSLSALAVNERTRIGALAESGSLRMRFPNVAGPALEAVLLNTAGGVACGDSFGLSVDVRSGAQLVITTPGAEKVYRSDGPRADYAVRLWIHPDASACWIPQETILFDSARIRRRLDVDMTATSSLLIFEAVVFGRAARGETMSEGAFEDIWRIRRDGRLAYADTFRLSGNIAERLRKPAVAAGARGIATCLYIAPDAEARLEEARAHLHENDCGCGASAWNNLLCVRFFAADVISLRRAAIRFLEGFRGVPLPRVWHS